MQNRKISCLVCVIVLFVTTGVALAGDVRLDENEEIQQVIGDLAALRTAAQMYYSEYGDNRVPPLSSILEYFEPGSLPPNATLLYSLKGDGRGWYVGYRAAGLKDETYALLQDDAQALGLLGDSLRAPWRRGSRSFWARALDLTAENTTAIIRKDTGDAILVFTSLIGIIANRGRDRCRYYVPGYDGYWRSVLVYRPAGYNRFFGRHYRPLPRFKNRERHAPMIRHTPYPRSPRPGANPPRFRSGERQPPNGGRPPRPQRPRPERRPPRIEKEERRRTNNQ
jgi:hypothetical protein